MTGARIAAPLTWRLAWRSPRSCWPSACLRGRIAAVPQDDPVALADHARPLVRRHGRRSARSRSRSPPTTPTLPRASSISRATAMFRSIPPWRQKSTRPMPARQAPRVRVGSFARGLITGEPDDLVGLAGTALGDLFVFGDIRDAVREGTRFATGQQADELILGLGLRRTRHHGGNLCDARRRRAGAAWGSRWSRRRARPAGSSAHMARLDRPLAARGRRLGRAADARSAAPA